MRIYKKLTGEFAVYRVRRRFFGVGLTKGKKL